MISNYIAALVGFCLRWRFFIILLGVVLGGYCAQYSVAHFTINSDTSALISDKVAWRQHEKAFDDAFPQRAGLIVAVIDGQTQESVALATNALEKSLQGHTDVFDSVSRPDGHSYFAEEGLLFLDIATLRSTSEELIRAQPFLGLLNADQSLRGLLHAFDLIAGNAQNQSTDLSAMVPTLSKLTQEFNDIAEGKSNTFSWREAITGKSAQKRDLRKFVLIKPVADYSSLEPGARATEFIRDAFKAVAQSYKDVSLRLTGPIPMADDEFSTLADGAEVNALVTLLVVLVILWSALRSWRLIAAVIVTLILGFTLTAALGLALVGALNLISIAFAVLFVGLGVDFGLQYCIRYRDERYKDNNLARSLIGTGTLIGKPLALAALATAAGFMSFLPTNYRGLSELGLIAGLGMVIAFITAVTFLPAFIDLIGAPREPEAMGFTALASIDRFIETHRQMILIGTAVVMVALAPFLWNVRFDFNPLDLRSNKVESVSTYLDLFKDPQTSPNTIDILEPSLAIAEQTASIIRQLPEVDHALTLHSLVPEDQGPKLEIVEDLSLLLEHGLAPVIQKPMPTDRELVELLRQSATILTSSSQKASASEKASLENLAKSLVALANAQPEQRAETGPLLIAPLVLTLEQIRQSLRARLVTIDDIPADLRHDWITKNGNARIEVSPKGDGNDNQILRKFVSAVLAIAPDATGTPVSIQASGKTVVAAFWQAAIWALVTITLLLFAVLRRASDVLMTLLPLLLAGVLTLELCGVLHMPLNFANIIALPLLLGVGVAFKVYFVMAWRSGQRNLLQSSLTRAVFYSALTTATAFGSLCFSNHPGTASMGRLMALALVCTLAAAVLFQPALMGPPRQKSANPPS